MVSAEQSHFISLFCESVLYGMYTVLFIALVASFRRNRHRKLSSLSIIQIVTVVQYLMSSTHIALAFYQNFMAFAVHENAHEEFNKLGAAPFTLAQMAIEFTNCALADSILIWRVWILWNKRVVIVIFPIIFITISTMSGYLVVYSMTIVDSSADSEFADLFGPAVEKWAILLAVCTVLTNIGCTGLIAGRIWWHNRELQKAVGVRGMSHRYRTVFYGVLESGALYLFAWIIAILLYLVNTAAIVPMLDIISQLTGIVPALIVLLISRNTDAHTHHEEALSTMRYGNNNNILTRTSTEFIPVHLSNSYDPTHQADVPNLKMITFADTSNGKEHQQRTGHSRQTNSTGVTVLDGDRV